MPKTEVTLVVDKAGNNKTLYTEAINLRAFGKLDIKRASHVEPDAKGDWWADMKPVHGPKLGPFKTRSAALKAEVSWLKKHRLGG